MATVVVPFRSNDPKRCLGAHRAELAAAMLADVLEAAAAVGPVFVVAPETPALPAGATHVPDPKRGQGAAVRAALDAAAATGAPEPYLVVNADLPCVTTRDLLALAGAVPDGGLALAAAADGTTNALALSHPELFEPVYGPGSAARFAALGESRVLAAPNLADDVDTTGDLQRLSARVGAHTRLALDALCLEPAA